MELPHRHWIIGNWHISIDEVDGLWAWRVDDLRIGLDPLALAGECLPDMNTALVKALDVVADFEAVDRIAINVRSVRELLGPDSD